MRKIILINASNVNGGGALSYLRWFIKNKENFKQKLKFIVLKELQIKGDKDFYVLNNSPSKSFASRKYVREIEKDCKPDLIYTIFGPSYVNFRSKHLMGIGDGWVFFWSFKLLSDVYKKDFLQLFLKFFEILYKFYYFRFANFYFCESSILKKKLKSNIFFSNKKCFVIKNLDKQDNFKKKSNFEIKYKKYFNKKYINILYVTDFRIHKNINYINQVFQKYNTKYNSEKKIRLILTVKKKYFLKIKNNLRELNKNYIINLGNVDYEDLKEIYNLSDFTILPSLIETFSSNIVESIKYNKVILLSNIYQHKMEFKNYFEYIDIYSLNKAVSKIRKILTNKVYLEKILNRQKKYWKINKIDRKKKFQELFNKLI